MPSEREAKVLRLALEIAVRMFLDFNDRYDHTTKDQYEKDVAQEVAECIKAAEEAIQSEGKGQTGIDT